MPKVIVSIDGVEIKEVQLSKDRTTLGRRPYNDIVIENLAVSGEHAVLEMIGNEVFLEDLNSTNGVILNGKKISRQQLHNGDIAELGKYKIRFEDEAPTFAKTMLFKSGAAPVARPLAGPGLVPAVDPAVAATASAATIKVLSGSASGREVPLTKVVTTIGKPGHAVAAITRRQHGFVVAHVEGVNYPNLNGSPIGAEPVALNNGDVIELAGTQMQFIQA
jgi:pSer/pThr/pTyr-binding forkhead associated (FHA) protein